MCSDKVLCVGMNYADHCIEQGAPIPKEPVIFKCVTTRPPWDVDKGLWSLLLVSAWRWDIAA
jgi:hypothetical protein